MTPYVQGARRLGWARRCLVLCSLAVLGAAVLSGCVGGPAPKPRPTALSAHQKEPNGDARRLP
jgi:hypothetical protein